MSNMAKYALIFGTGTDDDWVTKRKQAASDIVDWLVGLTPKGAVATAGAVSASIQGDKSLPKAIADIGEAKIQAHAPSFVRSHENGELQIKVIIMAAAVDLVDAQPSESGWSAPDAMAAAFWSALSFQQPLQEAKVEKLRTDLLAASRRRVLLVANSARKRRPIPMIGAINIDQGSAAGAKVNNAFSRAVEPMMTAFQENAALDREEIDFLWWLISDRSDILDESLVGMEPAVRAVVAGLDAAAKLRKLPSDAHRNIVLRNAGGGDPMSLPDLIAALGDRREKLAANLGSMPADVQAVFPLLRAIGGASGAAPHAGLSMSPEGWCTRALLEGSIHHLQAGTTGGL